MQQIKADERTSWLLAYADAMCGVASLWKHMAVADDHKKSRNYSNMGRGCDKAKAKKPTIEQINPRLGTELIMHSNKGERYEREVESLREKSEAMIEDLQGDNKDLRSRLETLYLSDKKKNIAFGILRDKASESLRKMDSALKNTRKVLDSPQYSGIKILDTVAVNTAKNPHTNKISEDSQYKKDRKYSSTVPKFIQFQKKSKRARFTSTSFLPASTV